ncbi:MAG: hypothetical protein NXI20_17965 [bacterium]|nr:hypothetical protein [bacterium]
MLVSFEKYECPNCEGGEINMTTKEIKKSSTVSIDISKCSNCNSQLGFKALSKLTKIGGISGEIKDYKNDQI